MAVRLKKKHGKGHRLSTADKVGIAMSAILAAGAGYYGFQRYRAAQAAKFAPIEEWVESPLPDTPQLVDFELPGEAGVEEFALTGQIEKREASNLLDLEEPHGSIKLGHPDDIAAFQAELDAAEREWLDGDDFGAELNPPTPTTTTALGPPSQPSKLSRLVLRGRKLKATVFPRRKATVFLRRKAK